MHVEGKKKKKTRDTVTGSRRIGFRVNAGGRGWRCGGTCLGDAPALADAGGAYMYGE